VCQVKKEMNSLSRENESPEIQSSDMKQNFIGRLISRYLTTDTIILIGYLLITFINAWDFLDRPINPGDYTGGEGTPMWDWLNRSRIVIYFFWQILFTNESMVYWGFFVFHILFALSFYYIAKKLKMNSLWIFAILLTVPLMRYGVNDYGGRFIGIIGLVMVWTYYLKRKDMKKLYIIVSIIGFFTKEFCLYVNMFFIIETFMQGIDFKNFMDFLKDLKPRIIRTIKTNLFEIILCIAYFIYRTIFTSVIGDYNPFDYGMFNFDKTGEDIGIIYFFTHPKVWFVCIMIFGMIWLILIKYPDLKIYVLLLFVIIFSSLFGLIWEIDKIGNIFIIITLELLTPKIWLNNRELSLQDTANTNSK